MIKCFDCKYEKGKKKGTITPGGKQNYIVTCIKEFLTFEIAWDSHKSNLPCYKNERSD